jgi:hypothetical protein
LGGGLAGLIGAAAAHVLATLASRAGSDSWLRGPYGPPFFTVALYTGVFYAPIGARAAKRAAAGAALGFLGAFLGILAPLYVLTRYGGWGMPRASAAGTHPWRIAIVVVYSLAIWSTIAAIGAASARTKPWRGALSAVLGSLAGYAVLAAALRLFSGLAAAPWNPASLIPLPVNLLDGLLSGAGLCLALSLDERISRRPL